MKQKRSTTLLMMRGRSLDASITTTWAQIAIVSDQTMSNAVVFYALDAETGENLGYAHESDFFRYEGIGYGTKPIYLYGRPVIITMEARVN
jgi:hypothetical protein